MTTTVIHTRAALVGRGPEVLEDATLVLEDGRIQAVFSGREGPLPEDPDRTFDFSDAYLLPGLIDTHVHLSLPGDGRPNETFIQERTDLELLLTAERNAERMLAAGVTAARDVGSRGRVVMTLRDAIGENGARGPRLVVAGSPITPTGGHCYYMGGEADGVDAVRHRARTLLKQGADFLKVMGSGGGTPGTLFYRPNFARPEMKAAVEEAWRRDTIVTVHATCVEALQVAIDAGVHMLEHAAMWNETPEGVEHTYQPDLTAMLVDRGIYVGPTLQASHAPLQKLRRAEEEGVITAAQREELDRRLGLFENTMDTFQKFQAAGVQLVAGTDAGWGLNPFGENYVTCLELAAEAGMPAWEVIEHATSRAAAAIGLDHQVGLIQPGMEADVLVVPDNPLQNVSTLRRPIAVFQQGQYVAQHGQLVTRAKSRA